MMNSTKQIAAYWITIFVLQFLVIVWYKGLLTPDVVPPPPPLPSDSLVMSEVNAGLTKQAIELVRNEVEEGKISSTELAIDALSAELPEAVRNSVLKALGQPEIEFLRDYLDILEGKIEVR